MIFIKHNSLKSDRFFNTRSIPSFSGSMFFRVQVFRRPGFSGFRFFRVQVFRVKVFLGPDLSGSRFFRVRFQGLGAGFRSSPHRSIYQQASLNKAIDQKIKSRFPTKLDGVWFSPDYQQ